MRIKLLCVGLTLGSLAATAQAPPVKLGLWEKIMTSTGGPGGPSTMKVKSCVTAAEWKEMVENSLTTPPGCKFDRTKTAKGYNFVGNCDFGNGHTMTIKGSSSIDDPEHISSQSHTTTTKGGKSTERESHSTSRFVSASCGNIKPDDPQVE